MADRRKRAKIAQDDKEKEKEKQDMGQKVSVDFPSKIRSQTVSANVVDFDENGTVIFSLDIENAIYSYRVNPHVLTLISQVWKAMFGPKSWAKEGLDLASGKHTVDNPLVVLILEDDPKALEKILWLAHHRPNNVARSRTLKDMVALAILSDKYALTSSIREQLAKTLDWQDANHSKYSKYKFENDTYWLLVSYFFGKKAKFKEISKKLVMDLPGDESSEMKALNKLEVVPEVVIADIKFMRFQAVESIMIYLKSKLQNLLDGKNCPGKFPEHTNHRKICDGTVLGHFLQWHREAFDGRLHVLEPKQVQHNLSALIRVLQKIKIPFYYKEPDARWSHRKTCSIEKEVNTLIKELRNEVTGLDYEKYCHKRLPEMD